MVVSTVGLVQSHFYIVRVPLLYNTFKIWIFDGICGFDITQICTLSCKNFHCWVKSSTYQYGLEWYWPKTKSIFVHLDIRIKYRYMITTIVLISTWRVFILCLTLIIDTMHSPITLAYIWCTKYCIVSPIQHVLPNSNCKPPV